MFLIKKNIYLFVYGCLCFFLCDFCSQYYFCSSTASSFASIDFLVSVLALTPHVGGLFRGVSPLATEYLLQMLFSTVAATKDIKNVKDQYFTS